jgi:hypothetical protein
MVRGMTDDALPDLLLPRDHERLKGVHPDLVQVVQVARQFTPFIVLMAEAVQRLPAATRTSCAARS